MTPPPMPRRALLALLLAAAMPAGAQEQGYRFDYEGAFQLLPQSGVFWGLPGVFAPDEDYDDSPLWLETYAQARVSFGDPAGLGTYGAAAALATATVGTDVFSTGDTGRIKIEELYLGRRWRMGDSLTADVSLGSRDYRLGEGMLYSTGGGNGFERGALTLAPHLAWSMAAVAKLEGESFGGEIFYLDPDELDSGDTHTRLFGVRAQWKQQETARLAVTWSRVIESEAPYPLAPFGLVANGRDGLETLSFDGRFEPKEGPLAGWSLRGEVATQRSNDLDLDAWGAVAEIGYRFTGARFQPRLSYSPRYFSGDDGSTPNTLERFDPLFYDGSPPNWSSGGSGSIAFYNSNLWVQRYRVDLVFSATSFANVSYYDVRAAERNSPVQYGQATRLGVVDGSVALVSGVPSRPLTSEWYLEYTRVFSEHWFLTVGVAVASPERGLQDVVPDSETWVGGLVNIAWRF
jgi:Alginate export